MSKSWTPEELAAASAAMKAEGHMSYEEFCAAPRRAAKICQAIQQIKNPSIRRAAQAEYIEIKESRLSGSNIQA